MMTTLWRLSDPVDHTYAEAARLGTWASGTGLCPECTASSQRRVKPLVIEWRSGSELVGDFTMVGFESVMVTERVAGLLNAHLTKVELGPVEMVQDAKLVRKTSSKPRVWLPYEGPKVHDLWVDMMVTADAERSSIELERRCNSCGTEIWEIYGVDRWDSHYDSEANALVREKTERVPNAGLILDRAQLGGAEIFRVSQFPSWIFCDDSVRQLIEAEQLSNIELLEMGDIE